MCLSHKGVFLSKQRLEQVAGMKAPTNLGELRSFLGTINFVRGYLPDLTQLCGNLLPLLKQKEVNEYVWTSGCQDDFTRIKEALSAGTILGIFDPEWETSLWIDFSKVGLGLALTQEHPRDRTMKKLIWCSSHRFRTQWEPKLPPIYGESRAANWAVRSCRYWLRSIDI